MSCVVSETSSRDVSSPLLLVGSGAVDIASLEVVARLPPGVAAGARLSLFAVGGSTVCTSVSTLLTRVWPVGMIPAAVVLVRFRVFRGGEPDTSVNEVSAKALAWKKYLTL